MENADIQRDREQALGGVSERLQIFPVAAVDFAGRVSRFPRQVSARRPAQTRLAGWRSSSWSACAQIAKPLAWRASAKANATFYPNDRFWPVSDLPSMDGFRP